MYKFDESQMVGKVFGMLTVLEKAPSDPVWRRSRWVCLCECGKQCVKLAVALRRNPTVSCGCTRYKKVSEVMRKYNTLADYLKNTTKRGDCFEWEGHLNVSGYAHVGNYKPKTGVTTARPGLVHRRVYQLVHGELPKVVMHTCDNRKCINPEHLVGGTQKENIQDAARKGRMFRQKNWKPINRS